MPYRSQLRAKVCIAGRWAAWNLRKIGFLDRLSGWRRQDVAIGDVDSERGLSDEVFQSSRTDA